MAKSGNTTNSIPRKCSVEACGRRAWAKGLCGKHYQRLRANGDTEIHRRSRTEKFLRDHVDHDNAECLLWPFGLDGDGYGYAYLSGATKHAHREMCKMAWGDPPFAKAEAAHECGNRACVNPKHLRWATRQQNSSDAVRHGRLLRGESHSQSRLTSAQVLRIFGDSRTNAEIAAEYGYAKESIARIRRGETWSHVTGHKRRT